MWNHLCCCVKYKTPQIFLKPDFVKRSVSIYLIESLTVDCEERSWIPPHQRSPPLHCWSTRSRGREGTQARHWWRGHHLSIKHIISSSYQHLSNMCVLYNWYSVLTSTLKIKRPYFVKNNRFVNSCQKFNLHEIKKEI